MKKGPSQIFVGKHLIWKTFKNWKMLPFFAKKTCLSKICRKICSTSCVLSSPPKRNDPKNETKSPTSTSNPYRGQTPWSSQWSSLREIPRCAPFEAEIPRFFGDFLGPREGLGGKMLPVYLENIGIRTIFVRQLDCWVLVVKLMEISSNRFSRYFF